MDEGEKAEATAMDEARMIAVVFIVQLDRIIINDTRKRIPNNYSLSLPPMML